MIEYVLGWKSDSNLAANKGTIVHKVLEVMAICKQQKDLGFDEIEDEAVGKIRTDWYNVDDVVDKVFGYYTKIMTAHSWSVKDLEECRSLTWKALQYNNGQFDPRNMKIVQPEQQFDISIEKPWAMYDYGNGVSGFLSLKGTIDLITKVDDNTYEIVDWKTGRRWDWAKDEEKTHSKLYTDPQLRLYHYVAQRLYPDKYIMATIFFIRDGGPFSICFTKDDMEATESIIAERFNEIKRTKLPVMNKSWKCSKLCHYGKNTFANTTTKPQVEFRKYKTCAIGDNMTMCEQVRFELEKNGMDKTIEKYRCPGFNVDFYQAPGGAQ